MNRIEGRDKVTGRARYAYEYPVENAAYAFLVQAEIARGRIVAIDDAAAVDVPGVLAVLSSNDPPLLGEDADPDLAVFQRREVAYRGEIVAAVIADTLEAARYAAGQVRVSYQAGHHDVELRSDHPRLYTPAKVNPAFPSVTEQGDLAAAL
ncbi:MAG: xanthine dehydrogenase family protein molybdopterin-binding subunit, partial [Streptosporangiaceae bacterium]